MNFLEELNVMISLLKEEKDPFSMVNKPLKSDELLESKF